MNFSNISIYDPFIACGSKYSIEVLKTGIIIKDDTSLLEIPYKNIITIKYIPLLTPNIILRFRINGENFCYTICSSNIKFKRIKCLYNEIVSKKSFYDKKKNQGMNL